MCIRDSHATALSLAPSGMDGSVVVPSMVGLYTYTRSCRLHCSPASSYNPTHVLALAGFGVQKTSLQCTTCCKLYAMAQILAQSTTLLSRYEQAAQKHPITTKVATCFVGFAAGDVVAQSISRPVRVSITTDGILTGTETLRQKVEVDFVRALRMALFGALIAAPQMHIFHGWMERVRFLLPPFSLDSPCW